MLKELEDSILNGTSDKKIAYLTFDDGPYYNTYKVLKILKENKVKATFFTTNVNGEHCFDNKSKNSNNNVYQKANTVTPGNNTNLKSNIIGSSQNSTPTPLPGMGGQNFVLRRKNPININNNSNNLDNNHSIHRRRNNN